MAVGSSIGATGRRARALVERYTNGSWVIARATDRPGFKINELESVSCPSANACVAVGASSPVAAPGVAGRSDTLVELWNGADWRRVPSPSPTRFSELTDVSCASPGSCTATGDTRAGSASVAPLVERWNGASWRVVSASLTDAVSLDGISCTDGGACTVIGLGSSGPVLTVAPQSASSRRSASLSVWG
jgi:hypothetical protein